MLTEKRDDEGFTLIELMVVVLIIAILIAIAIPTFLGAQDRAKNKAAQSNLRNTLTAAKVLYTDTGDYSSANYTNLGNAEKSLTFTNVAVSTANWVAVANTTTTFTAAAQSGSGTCFLIQDSGGTVSYASTTATSCTTSATATFGSKWLS